VSLKLLSTHWKFVQIRGNDIDPSRLNLDQDSVGWQWRHRLDDRERGVSPPAERWLCFRPCANNPDSSQRPHWVVVILQPTIANASIEVSIAANDHRVFIASHSGDRLILGLDLAANHISVKEDFGNPEIRQTFIHQQSRLPHGHSRLARQQRLR
jgi:hypothetical protein